jgi:fatty-acyl-CoA synthase
MRRGTPLVKTARAVFPVRNEADLERLEAEPYEALVPWDSIYGVFEATAGLFGDRAALTVLGDAPLDDEPVVYTHSRLLQDITRAANLFAGLGLTRGETVAILARTHARVPPLIWGAATAATVNCVNYLLTPEVIVALLQAARARVLVCPGPALDAALWEKACEVARRLPDLRAVLVMQGGTNTDDPRFLALEQRMDAQPGDRLTRASRPGQRDIAALFHTGGTTGLPKLVPQTHLNQIHAAWSLAQGFGITEQDVALNGFPLFHVGGTSTIGMSVLAAGGHVVMLSPSGLRNPEVVRNIWRLAERHRASILGGVPTSIGAMSEVPVDGSDLSSVRFAFTGGSPLPSAIGQRFETRTGIPLLEQYGMTESVAAITATPFHGERIRGSVGIRSPFSSVAIMREESRSGWQSCAPGETGVVVVKGPQIVNGYLDPRHNAEMFTADGGLVTGDLGHLDANGYLFLTGRAKDLIIRSGHNIDPLVIEEVANAHPAVAVSAAVGMPDEYAGELPVVFVEPIAGEAIDAAALLRFIAERISEPPARPRLAFLLDAMPVTGVGKIFKPALRERALDSKLRAMFGELGGDIEILDIRTEPDGAGANVRLRAPDAGRQSRQAPLLAANLERLPVRVRVEWEGGAAQS